MYPVLLVLAFLVAVVQHHTHPIDDDTWTHLTLDSGLHDLDIRTIIRDHNGHMWLGSRNQGIARFNPEAGTWAYYTEKDNLRSNGILSLHEDPSGHIWAAGGGGYSVYDGRTWQKHAKLGDLDVRVVFSVSGDDDGRIGLAANGGARWYNGSTWRFFSQADGLPHRVVHSIYQAGDGTVWFACRTGLARWVGSDIEILYPEENFRAILSAGETIWFGTGGAGIYEYVDGAWKKHLPGQTVLPIFIDRAGHLWAATEGSGAYRFDGAEWHHYDTEKGLISNTVFSIAETTTGHIWFGTDQGVSIYKPAGDER